LRLQNPFQGELISCLHLCVIAGAFELEGRLLHEKDGLAL
jgi:hypothetical protein